MIVIRTLLGPGIQPVSVISIGLIKLKYGVFITVVICQWTEGVCVCVRAFACGWPVVTDLVSSLGLAQPQALSRTRPFCLRQSPTIVDGEGADL